MTHYSYHLLRRTNRSQATRLYLPEAIECVEFVKGAGGGLELVISARGQAHLTYVNLETMQQRKVSRERVLVRSRWGAALRELFCSFVKDPAPRGRRNVLLFTFCVRVVEICRCEIPTDYTQSNAVMLEGRSLQVYNVSAYYLLPSTTLEHC